jgi:hypothetical protein
MSIDPRYDLSAQGQASRKWLEPVSVDVLR